jgi:hypothetical protein
MFVVSFLFGLRDWVRGFLFVRVQIPRLHGEIEWKGRGKRDETVLFEIDMIGSQPDLYEYWRRSC